MKKINILLVLFFTTSIFFACNNNSTKSETENEKEVKNASENAVNYTVDTKTSILKWKGSKPASFHEGTISIKSGEIKVEENVIKSGSVVIDMNTIVNTDLTDADYNKKLVGHLSGEDFFNVAKYPTAKFEITSFEKNGDNYMAYGNLTVKDITKNIGFPVDVNISGDEITVTAKPFTIDRTEWEIKYNSGKFFSDLKDNIILDNIEISFELKAKTL